LFHHCRDVLDREAYDAFIFGHRHLPLDLEVTSSDGARTARYLNCGDWIGHRTYVTLDGDGPALRHWT
ncbi:MAG: UDP-2,3-diacylglucosamine diphosphatase, partial [Flavobacteriales bacterium]